MHCFMYTSQHKMTSFTSSSEVLGLLLYGDEKRRVHFRIVDSVLSTGNQRRFGLTEYLTARSTARGMSKRMRLTFR